MKHFKNVKNFLTRKFYAEFDDVFEMVNATKDNSKNIESSTPIGTVKICAIAMTLSAFSIIISILQGSLPMIVFFSICTVLTAIMGIIVCVKNKEIIEELRKSKKK